MEQGKRFWSRRDAAFSVLVPQPHVQAQCFNYTNFTLNELSAPLGLNATSGQFTLPVPVVNADEDQFRTLNITHKRLTQFWGNHSIPDILWLDEPQLKNTTKSTLNAIVSIPRAANGQSLLFPCSIDSALPPTLMSTRRNSIKTVEGLPGDYLTTAGSFPKIDLSSTWAKYLNPRQIHGSNTTVFARMASTAGLWETTVPSDDYNYMLIVESILATMVANGLGRSTYNHAIAGYLRESNAADPRSWPKWMYNILPSGNMGFNDDQRDSAFDKLSASELKRVKAGIVALFTYIVIAGCHTAYSLWTGWASTMSESSMEVAILTANSRPSRKLLNTGAGVDTLGIYTERVRVRARDEKLELVFRDTEEGSERIKKNHAYG